MGTVTAAAATAGGTPVWAVVVIAILGSSLIGTLITTTLTGLRGNAAGRRDGYAAAVRALVAWWEYPYRIRRRTSDDAATLSALASLGHDLQEQLAHHRGWVAAESAVLSRVYDEALAKAVTPVATACREAWKQPPVSSASDMNLSGFGPGDVNGLVQAVQCAVIYRFGWRRLFPDWWRTWRLKQRGCLAR